VWEQGAMHRVRMLEDSGQAYVADIEFRDVGVYPVYPYPHPETITLPMNLPGVQHVTNRGVVFPLPYFELTKQMVLADMCSTDPLLVDGHTVIPIDVAVARLIQRRPALLAEAGVAGPAGCLRIDVGGYKEGGFHTYVFSLSSSSAGAGEGTGIPAGLGALLMARGGIGRPGVHAPEALVDPVAMLALAAEVLGELKVGGAPGGSLPVHISHRGPDGTVDDVDLVL
jgi:saccharopine dehydrogenase-like NADP-dependent oxidoreductase